MKTARVEAEAEQDGSLNQAVGARASERKTNEALMPS